MRTILRRLRGVATTALVWAVVWGLTGVALVAYQAVRHWSKPYVRHRAAELIVDVPPAFALLGAFSGVVFAIVLASLERRRTFEELSVRRVAAWGALGGWHYPFSRTSRSSGRSRRRTGLRSRWSAR